ncbi:MAG: hypothetical protein AB1656_03590 [Candidatus Omnitrophota bacterium]
MWEDPIVKEIRKYREEYAAQFNYDLKAIYLDIKEKEKQSGRQIVFFPPKRMAPPRKESEVAQTPNS